MIQPPFEELKKDNGSLKRDKTKFEQILMKFEERRQKWLRLVQDEKTELEYNRAILSIYLLLRGNQMLISRRNSHIQWRTSRSCTQRSGDWATS